MKNLTFLAVALLAGVCAQAFGTSCATPALNIKTITAEVITLKSPDGRHTVTISATDRGAGFWITEADSSRAVCIYNLEREGTAIASLLPCE